MPRLLNVCNPYIHLPIIRYVLFFKVHINIVYPKLPLRLDAD